MRAPPYNSATCRSSASLEFCLDGVEDWGEVRGCFLAVFGLLFRVKVICLLCLRLCLPESPECFAGWVAGFPREGIVESRE